MVIDLREEPYWNCAHFVLNSTSLQLIPAYSSQSGLPLLLWTPSRHNSEREVRDGQTTSEFHAGV